MKFIENLPTPILNIAAALTSKIPRLIIGFRYFLWTGKFINWTSPSNLQEYVLANVFNARKDKKQLKLYSDLADKIAVREYSKNRLGKDITPEVYGIWTSANDIKWDLLPESFVIKTNNSCGTNIIVKDKSSLDKPKTTRQLQRWLKFPYGKLTGQIHYSLIKPRIFAEQLLFNDSNPGALPPDYKFFCFNGVPVFILYYEDRKINGHITPNQTFDTNWQPLNDLVLRPVEHSIPAPKSLDLMLRYATQLSKNLPFARIDFYEIDGKPYLGEITLTPDVITNFKLDFLRDVITRFALKP